MNRLLQFENTFTRNFTEPSFITRTEFDHKTKKILFWGIPVKKAVHTITIGSTGSGKSQRVIIPSAVINARLEFEKKPCMVFSDPKGELQTELSSKLITEGYEVLILNLREPMYSNSWNPLNNAYNLLISSINYVKEHVNEKTFNTKILFNDYVKNSLCKKHKKNNCDTCIKEILTISDNIDNEQTNKNSNLNSVKYPLILTFKPVTIFEIDGFWLVDPNLAKELISGEINKLKNLAYGEINDLAATLLNPGADDKNKQWYDGAQGIFKGVIFAMMEMIEEDIDSIKENQFNIVTVTTHLSNKDNLQKFFKSWSVGRETNQSVIAANKVLTSSPQSIGNFFSIVSTALSLFEGNELRSLLCKNDINLFEFIQEEKPKAIFMVVPDDRTEKHPLASLFISQLYKAGVFCASKNLVKRGKDALDRDVIFYLDEFGNFPPIVNFSTILTVSRGRRMFFNLVVQSFEQLEKKYGNSDAETIKANCLLTVYLRSASSKTHATISEMCGQTTVEVRNSEPSIGKDGRKYYPYHLQKKPLIEPSDIKHIFPEPKPGETIFNKYAIIIYQDSNPSIVELEYAFKMDLTLKENEVTDLPINNAIDFENNYYVNLFKLTIKPKIHDIEQITDDVNLNEVNLEEENHNKFKNRLFKDLSNATEKDIDDLLELKTKERQIRNDLYVLQSRSEDLLSTDEKEQIKKLQKELKLLLKKL
ncbi:type IV secretory system conjugative DNA transfer family protein [Spiroplasma taiwanense]|uniref:Conjugation protein n=1 Tax=Spiroplasma taiwanense CT-1 TaxID=1276220 RepID=S5LTR4_9MOLU|nr:type IV secretory system conjugative DNA transfer family protein [Spiroplasma taiwanense]AGR41104.1 conjugation protein [Spiroplasma taiwanense CT-1]